MQDGYRIDMNKYGEQIKKYNDIMNNQKKKDAS